MTTSPSSSRYRKDSALGLDLGSPSPRSNTSPRVSVHQLVMAYHDDEQTASTSETLPPGFEPVHGFTTPERNRRASRAPPQNYEQPHVAFPNQNPYSADAVNQSEESILTPEIPRPSNRKGFKRRVYSSNFGASVGNLLHLKPKSTIECHDDMMNSSAESLAMDKKHRGRFYKGNFATSLSGFFHLKPKAAKAAPVLEPAPETLATPMSPPPPPNSPSNSLTPDLSTSISSPASPHTSVFDTPPPISAGLVPTAIDFSAPPQNARPTKRPSSGFIPTSLLRLSSLHHKRDEPTVHRSSPTSAASIPSHNGKVARTPSPERQPATPKPLRRANSSADEHSRIPIRSPLRRPRSVDTIESQKELLTKDQRRGSSIPALKALQTPSDDKQPPSSFILPSSPSSPPPRRSSYIASSGLPSTAFRSPQTQAPLVMRSTSAASHHSKAPSVHSAHHSHAGSPPSRQNHIVERTTTVEVSIPVNAPQDAIDSALGRKEAAPPRPPSRKSSTPRSREHSPDSSQGATPIPRAVTRGFRAPRPIKLVDYTQFPPPSRKPSVREAPLRPLPPPPTDPLPPLTQAPSPPRVSKPAASGTTIKAHGVDVTVLSPNVPKPVSVAGDSVALSQNEAGNTVIKVGGATVSVVNPKPVAEAVVAPKVIDESVAGPAQPVQVAAPAPPVQAAAPPVIAVAPQPEPVVQSRSPTPAAPPAEAATATPVPAIDVEAEKKKKEAEEAEKLKREKEQKEKAEKEKEEKEKAEKEKEQKEKEEKEAKEAEKKEKKKAKDKKKQDKHTHGAPPRHVYPLQGNQQHRLRGMFIAPRPYMAGLGYPQLAVRFMPGVPHMPMARPILQHRIGYGPMGPMYNPTTYRTGYAPPPAPPIRRH